MSPTTLLAREKSHAAICIANLHQPPLDGFELPLTPDAELPGAVVLVPGIGEIAPLGL
jgi:hypothetical protein